MHRQNIPPMFYRTSSPIGSTAQKGEKEWKRVNFWQQFQLLLTQNSKCKERKWSLNFWQHSSLMLQDLCGFYTWFISYLYGAQIDIPGPYVPGAPCDLAETPNDFPDSSSTSDLPENPSDLPETLSDPPPRPQLTSVRLQVASLRPRVHWLSSHSESKVSAKQ